MRVVEGYVNPFVVAENKEGDSGALLVIVIGGRRPKRSGVRYQRLPTPVVIAQDNAGISQCFCVFQRVDSSLAVRRGVAKG